MMQKRISELEKIVAQHTLDIAQMKEKLQGQPLPAKPKPPAKPAQPAKPQPSGGTWPDLANASSKATDAVGLHNKYRREHGVPDVTWDDSLAAIAQNAANFLSASNLFQHSGSPGGPPAHGHGENIAGGKDINWAVRTWVDERNKIPDDIPDGDTMFNYAGHFSACVWKDTKRIGCGIGPTGTIVCVYDPPGNYTGANYKTFVPPIVGTHSWKKAV
jgi:hypothetical protein